jgi:predicted peptidase
MARKIPLPENPEPVDIFHASFLLLPRSTSDIPMKIHPILAFIVLLLVSACNKEDEILPTLAATDSVVAAADSSVISNPEVPEKDSSAADSAIYQRAKFQDMPYRILFPKNYDPNKRYPMFIFLHGIGERGNDNEQQLRWGSSLFLRDSVRDHYPAFVIFPQCQSTHYWFDASQTETLKKLIEAIVAKHGVDNHRIFIGGLSMGAYGTYAMVAKYPGLFAAAVAISGDGDVSKAPAMAKTKWRIFAGKKDNVVASDKSEKMATALKKSGASVSFTLYPNADHTGSWVNAFSEPDFCSWIFSTH